MTPFQTPHTSHTPRYGQMTPIQNGPFVHPGAPVSSRGNFSGASPQVRGSGSYSIAQEKMEWEQAAEAWGAPRGKTTPRDTGRSTPRG